MQWQLRFSTKKTGGLLKRHGKKKKFQRGRDFLPGTVGEKKIKSQRTKGGSYKRIMTSGNFANVIADGKAKKTKILSVVENKANLQYTRQNIMTRGAVINTDLGRARVTSRPGQEGNVNAVLIEKKS